MRQFITLVLVGLISSFAELVADSNSKIGSLEINIPDRPVEFTHATLDCWCDLNRHDTQTQYTLSWYKNEKEFYRFTSKNKDDPIEVFDVAGTHVNKLFCDERSIYLDDISYQSPGMYRCKVTTDGPNPETKFKDKKMEIRFFPSYGNFFYCKPKDFNNKKSTIIACYFVVNGTTNVYNKPWNFNWYKDNQLIYSYSITKEETDEEEGDYINNESEDIIEIKHPHVPGVFLDSQLTYKNSIVLHHLGNKSIGRYECEITLNQTGSRKPIKHRFGTNIRLFDLQ